MDPAPRKRLVRRKRAVAARTISECMRQEFIKTPGLIQLTGALKHVSRVKVMDAACDPRCKDSDLHTAAKIQRAKYNHFASGHFPEVMKELCDSVTQQRTGNSDHLLSLIYYVLFDWYIDRAYSKPENMAGASDDVYLDRDFTNSAVTCVEKGQYVLKNAEPGAYSADIHEAQAWMCLALAMKWPKYGAEWKEKAFVNCELARDHYITGTNDQEEIATKSVHYISMMLFITLQVPMYKTVLKESKIYQLWNPEKNFTSRSVPITWSDIWKAEKLIREVQANITSCTSTTLLKWSYAAQVHVFYGNIYLHLRKGQLYGSEKKYDEAEKTLSTALEKCDELLQNKFENYTNFSQFIVNKVRSEIKPLIESERERLAAASVQDELAQLDISSNTIDSLSKTG